MVIDKNNPKHLIADEGKVLVRTIGYPLMGMDIYLGTVIVDGVTQEDVASNYKEVDAPEPTEMEMEGGNV